MIIFNQKKILCHVTFFTYDTKELQNKKRTKSPAKSCYNKEVSKNYYKKGHIILYYYYQTR